MSVTYRSGATGAGATGQAPVAAGAGGGVVLGAFGVVLGAFGVAGAVFAAGRITMARDPARVAPPAAAPPTRAGARTAPVACAQRRRQIWVRMSVLVMVNLSLVKVGYRGGLARAGARRA
jgi:hypothetical protein